MNKEQFSGARSWHVLVNAAKRAAEEAGFQLRKVPGRGLSNVHRLEGRGRSEIVAIRTTRDRWIAFPPLDGGKKWKTLDDVQKVLVATVNSHEAPTAVEVYLLPAEDVRSRFAASYAARRKAGNALKDNFGMWVCLDTLNRGVAGDVGSGIIDKYDPIAVYSLVDLLAGFEGVTDIAEGTDIAKGNEDELRTEGQAEEKNPTTIAEVLAWARKHIAQIAGVRSDAVKLDLKLDF